MNRWHKHHMYVCVRIHVQSYNPTRMQNVRVSRIWVPFQTEFKCLVQKYEDRFRKYHPYKHSVYFCNLQISHMVLKYELVSRDFWSKKVEVFLVEV